MLTGGTGPLGMRKGGGGFLDAREAEALRGEGCKRVLALSPSASFSTD